MMNNNEAKKIIPKYLGAVLVLLLACGMASTALATEVSTGEVAVEGSVEPEKNKEEWKAPWRGSRISYSNTVSALTLNKDADPTYNPYYEMSWGFSPMWWVGDVFNTFASFSFARELTHSDWTTYANETYFNDVKAGFGFSNFYKIPVLEIGMSAKVKLTAPTSKASQARSLILGVSPSLALSRNFDVLAGIGLNYSFGVTKSFHEYTTVGREEPLYTDCTSGCGEYLNTGRRNSEWNLSNGFGLSVGFVEWLAFSANVAVLHSVLYAQEDVTAAEMSDWNPGDEQRVKYAMLYGFDLTASPMPAFDVSIGTETYNPMQKPNSTYESPFFNRYTNFYLTLTLNVAGLVDQLTSSEE